MAIRRDARGGVTPALHDPEIDNQPRRPADPHDLREAAEVPERYQRLLANPFLAAFSAVAWFGLFRSVIGLRRLDVFLPVAGAAVLIPLLFQYHCLDCGATGHLLRWRRHDCLSVRLRRDLNRPRRLRGPTPVAQTVAWGALAALAALFSFAAR